MSIFSSASGGLFAKLVLMFLSPQLAEIALTFGPAEFFAACVMALTVISSLGGKSVHKALLSGLLGLFFATIGIDPMSGVERFTYGSMTLMTGIGFVPAFIGLFAISEVIRQTELFFKLKERNRKSRLRCPPYRSFAD